MRRTSARAMQPAQVHDMGGGHAEPTNHLKDHVGQVVAGPMPESAGGHQDAGHSGEHQRRSAGMQSKPAQQDDSRKQDDRGHHDAFGIVRP